MLILRGILFLREKDNFILIIVQRDATQIWDFYFWCVNLWARPLCVFCCLSAFVAGGLTEHKLINRRF